MQKTTFYEMSKPELTDASDIRVLNPNFDTIDAELRSLRETVTTLETQVNALLTRVASLESKLP